MSTPFTPTPDMLAILADVERNPRSKLLRLPIQLGNPGTFEVILGGDETFLNSAERKLVRTYRDELEEYFFYRGQELLASSPWGRKGLVNSQEKLVQNDGMDLSPTRGERLSEALHSGSSNSKRIDVACSTPTEFFSAAARLVPKDSTRIMLALAQQKLGGFGAALKLLQTTLHSNSSLEIKAIAAKNLGLLYWQAGSYDIAAKSYLWAAKLRPTDLDSLAFALISSALDANWERVTHLEKALLDRGLHSDHLRVKRLVEFCKTGSKETQNYSSRMSFIPPPKPVHGSLTTTLIAPYLKDRS